MKHSITIKYECPLCGGTLLQSLDKVKGKDIKNVFCPFCKFDTPSQDVFMEPLGMIQTIETNFEEPVYFIPSNLLYVDLADDYLKHCDACKKCETCIEDTGDNYCTGYRPPCNTTCPECSSSTTRKLLFLQENHFSYEECWSLDSTLATFILVRLKEYAKNVCGYPSDLSDKPNGFGLWKRYLRMMILFFRMKEKDCVPFISTPEENSFTELRYKIYCEGKRLFCEYLESLWD